MSYSTLKYLGDGSTVSFSTPEYIQRSHIKVYANGTLVDPSEYSWTGPTIITFGTAPTSGTALVVARDTSRSTRLVNYTQPSVLDADTLNLDSRQAFLMAQEAFDQSDNSMTGDVAETVWDAEGRPIINAGPPASDADVATKWYVDQMTVAPGQPLTVADYAALRSLTAESYTQSRVFVMSPSPGDFYLDAVDTASVDDGGVCIVDTSGRRWKRVEHLRGYVSPSWWGAKPGGDAATNTAAIQSAINKMPAYRVLFTERGVYDISDSLTAQAPNYSNFGVRIDFGGSSIVQTVGNIPILKILGWHRHAKIENGLLRFLTQQPQENTKAACIAFGNLPGSVRNGTNNLEIHRITFQWAYSGIDYIDADGVDDEFALWDTRIEYCRFIELTQHAVDLQQDPAYSIITKNILIRSCFVDDNYVSTSGVLFRCFNVFPLTIQDVEIIRSRRRLFEIRDSLAKIMGVSWENPGREGIPITYVGQSPVYLWKTAANIDSLHVMSVRFDIGAGVSIPIIESSGNSSVPMNLVISNVVMQDCYAISGNFAIIGGLDRINQITVSSHPSYRSTPKQNFPLFFYNPSEPFHVASTNSRVLQYDGVRLDNTTSGFTSVKPQSDEASVLHMTDSFTGAVNVGVYPATPTDSTNYPYVIGEGWTIEITKRQASSFPMNIQTGEPLATIGSIPSGSSGSITLVWKQGVGWVLKSKSVW